MSGAKVGDAVANAVWAISDKLMAWRGEKIGAGAAQQFGDHLRRASAVTGRPESSFDTINLVRIRRLWDPVAGSCYSVPARANKSWSRYHRPKIERSCIEAYPERAARTRQTKFLIPIRRTRPS
jgi:hypothetical protein